MKHEALYFICSLITFCSKNYPGGLCLARYLIEHYEIFDFFLSILKEQYLIEILDYNKILVFSALERLFGLDDILQDGQTEGYRYQEEFEKKGGLDVLE